jgi:lipid II:glycine glycyltransferase (peptidoglycan interpeptide bridge formation enzyme)
MADIYNEVVDLKKSFRADWRADPNRLSQFVASFGDAFYLVRAVSPDGTTLAYRAAVTFGTVGFDILAATRHEGRKCYASHVATHGLLEHLGKAGYTHYDFGGVDRNNNSGVYNFKHGAGGSDHCYMGEWHISTPRPARRLIERMIQLSLTKGR